MVNRSSINSIRQHELYNASIVTYTIFSFHDEHSPESDEHSLENDEKGYELLNDLTNKKAIMNRFHCFYVERFLYFIYL